MQYLFIHGAGPDTTKIPDCRNWTKLSIDYAQAWVAPETPYLVGAREPLFIVGDLFLGSARLTSLTPGQEIAITTSHGAWLSTHCWGRYIAFWRDLKTGDACAMRDPSAMMPVLYSITAERTAVASDPKLLLPAVRLRAMIDARGVAHRLWYPGLSTRRTGLDGVSEILPGEMIRFGRHADRRQIWAPTASQGTDDAAANGSLRDTICTATATLCAGRRLVLKLSGGIDSSILAAALNEMGADWQAATLVTPGRDGDERAYAGLVAELYSASLHALSAGPADINLLSAPRRAEPYFSGTAMLEALDRKFEQVADRGGGATIVSGTGGDNVLCSLRSAAPILDALAVSPRTAIRTLQDMSMLTATPLATVAMSTVRYWLRHRRQPVRWRHDPALLAPASRPALDPHPWLIACADRGYSAGTRAHVAAVLRAQHVIAGYSRTTLYPLLAQPVLEHCFAIPARNWVLGGRDRAVARDAFRSDLPAAIYQRRTKGRLTSLLAPAFNRDRAALREILLDGRLAAMGLLDRPALEDALKSEADADGRTYTRITELTDAELWTRNVMTLV